MTVHTYKIFLSKQLKYTNLFFTFALCPNAFLDVSKLEANSTIREAQFIPQLLLFW